MSIKIYQSHLQEIIIEKENNTIRLTIDGDLQFDSNEDYIYSEAMSHIPMKVLSHLPNCRVLILGWGDGLIAKELISYKNIIQIDICDYDSTVIDICKNDPDIAHFNNNIFDHEKVIIHYEDAYNYIENHGNTYDLIIADFPDVHTIETVRLFSLEFYTNIAKILSPNGVFITLACEVRYTYKAFLSIYKTLQQVFIYLLPFHKNMPRSYGNFGMILASKKDILSSIVPKEEHVTISSTIEDININTVSNSMAHHYFMEETLSSGFIPWITNKND